MNRLSIQITFTDGTVINVLSSAGDLVKWETHFSLGIDKLETMTHLLYLAYLIAKREGKASAEFDVWVDTVAVAEVIEPKK
jgi:hypothetical protein